MVTRTARKAGGIRVGSGPEGRGSFFSFTQRSSLSPSRVQQGHLEQEPLWASLALFALTDEVDQGLCLEPHPCYPNSLPDF